MPIERDNSDFIIKALISAVCIGLASAIIGAFSIGGTLTSTVFTRQETMDPFFNFTANALLLIIGKIILDLTFSIFAILLLYLAGRIATIRTICLIAGIFETMVLVFFLSLFWYPGWNQILEPSGEFFASLLQVILGFVQSGAILVAGIKK